MSSVNNNINTEKDDLTPMMRQYYESKAQAGDKLLFYRMGDFYELFGDDALKAAPILGIALTSRDRNKENPTPMCGVPFHAIANYISKLTNKGLSVAICEQLEDPKQAKGIVKRGLVRIVTPSIVYDSDSIDVKKQSYLASLIKNDNFWNYSYLDYSTGEFAAGTALDVDDLLAELSIISPKEVIYPRSTELPEALKKLLNEINFTAIETKRSNNNEMNKLIIDSNITNGELSASKLIISYITETQLRNEFPHIRYLSKVYSKQFMGLDEFTCKNLEIFSSFLNSIDMTLSPMGGRKIRQWVSQPLQKKNEINKRLDNVQKFINQQNILDRLRSYLSKCGDIERLSSKIALNQFNPRDLYRLCDSILTAETIIDSVSNIEFDFLNKPETKKVSTWIRNIISFLEEEAPLSCKDGGIFKKGFSKELDELIDLSANGKTMLLDIEKREKEQTGISSLKVRFNNVFGYYIEVTKTNLHLVPQTYIRKQTIVNGERFITEELKELEYKLLSAEENRNKLEYQLLLSLAETIRNEFISTLVELGEYVACIDVLSSFAQLTINRHYKRPEISENYSLTLKDFKHPVLEQMLGSEFIANDITLDEKGFFVILTGPNMAGKSTVMRSIALITIMSHIGCFVPCSQASIPIIDRVFTRVGATDFILRGQSTFMVEMIETANIIRSATQNSLVILDEIGRGTSTYDGISIAWAVGEHIHNKIKAKCLFATHYHELTILENELEGVKNLSMSVQEAKNGLFFLRKLVEKPASKSYGIQVANMAGLPKTIITRAYNVLSKLEDNRTNNSFVNIIDQNQLPLFNTEPEDPNTKKLLVELQNIDLNKLTPIEALNRLYQWKNEVSKEE